MPGLGDPTGTRLVPMTRDHRTIVEWAARDLAKVIRDAEAANAGDPDDLADVTRRVEHAVALLHAYDAAPAAYGDLRDDPRGKILRAVSKAFREDYGTPAFTVDAVTNTVLAALGCVVERPANTGDHHA